MNLLNNSIRGISCFIILICLSAASGLMAQKCQPAFPLVQGWVGGDGDVSVPLNDSTTLFLFSDSYVGRTLTATRRDKGIRMIANTVGVQTCRGGSSLINYYWKKMYSADPLPIFECRTPKCKYWINDAFILNKELYVLLEMIGPKKNAAPGDLFNFASYGYVLAHIPNPQDNPLKWAIKETPLKGFIGDTLSIRAMVPEGEYIYLFISRFDKIQHLIRTPVHGLNGPIVPFERYAQNKTWKEGVLVTDMDTLIHGFRANTVNYHPDSRLWVMVIDIFFMDNKIKVRTSPSLTGPWSDEILIYEIPEVTQGKERCIPGNFCYLPRECIQFYNPLSGEITLTYDINNDLNQVILHDWIYTPQVIKVRLPK